MKKNNLGFTLIELLIAATIIGILAVFATISYRNSVADTRVAGARARLDMLAGAVQRYHLDPGVCPGISSGNLTIASLYDCGLLEKNAFQDADNLFNFYICTNTTVSSACGTGNLACMSGTKTSKLPARYWESNGYSYCQSLIGKPTEKLGAE